MNMGNYKTEYFDKAIAMDPKNESGLYESALVGRIASVDSEETMLSSLEAVKAYAGIDKVVDKGKGVRIYSIAAFFAMKHKQDMVLAKIFAEKSAALGGKEDETFGDIIKGILDTKETKDEAGHEGHNH